MIVKWRADGQYLGGHDQKIFYWVEDKKDALKFDSIAQFRQYEKLIHELYHKLQFTNKFETLKWKRDVIAFIKTK